MPLAMTAMTSPLLRGMRTTTSMPGRQHCQWRQQVHHWQWQCWQAPCQRQWQVWHTLSPICMQVCPESQCMSMLSCWEHLLSAVGTEILMLSVRAESIILSAQLAKSMILSPCCRRTSVPWESACECAFMLKASYSQRAALRVWYSQRHPSGNRQQRWRNWQIGGKAIAMGDGRMDGTMGGRWLLPMQKRRNWGDAR